MMVAGLVDMANARIHPGNQTHQTKLCLEVTLETHLSAAHTPLASSTTQGISLEEIYYNHDSRNESSIKAVCDNGCLGYRRGGGRNVRMK